MRMSRSSRTLEEELGKLKNRWLLSQRMAKAEAAISDYADKLSRKQRCGGSKADGIVTAELEAAKDKHNRLRVDISALLRQADALRRMEELFEGYNGACGASWKPLLPASCAECSARSPSYQNRTEI